MKLPNPGTDGCLVLEYLVTVQAATLDEIRAALHGRVSPSKVSVALSRRREACQVTLTADKWAINAKTAKDMRKVPAPDLEIVPPRDAPICRPLNPRYYLNPLGSRPGSNDLRNVSSRY